MANLQISLSYDGSDAASHELDFYDASVALIGFQRSLAIVTHLVVNGQIITQAPTLKNARIMAAPPKSGSWEIPVLITFLVGAAYKAGTAPKDTPLGHLVRSAYDFVVAAAFGFHVDYEKSLGQQYEQLKSENAQVPVVRPSQLESAVEKCEVAIRDMHRPMT